jgi:glycosyltransferase involved in cell wall biosynthesis
MGNLTDHYIKEFLAESSFKVQTVLNNDSSYPKISIVTPSYNQAEFLERTIVSILNQNYPNLEYIVIDGGSNDGSVEIIRKYEKYLTYWVSEKDLGQSHALNKGFRICTGDLIGWQNSDDIYLPGAFHELAGVASTFNNYDIYYSNHLYIGQDDRVVYKIYFVPPSWRFMEYYHKFRGMNLCTQATFFRKKVLDTVGLIDESLQIAMDVDFFLRCMLLKMQAYYCKAFWGAIRMHGRAKTQIFDRNGKEVRAEREYVERKHNLYRGKFLPLINSGLAVWRTLLLIKSGGFGETCKLRLLNKVKVACGPFGALNG